MNPHFLKSPRSTAAEGRDPSILDWASQGWHAADLHVHTFCSYDVVKAPWLHPEVLYQKARSLGMRFITFTDHDTMDAYDLLRWTREGLVPGVEIKICDRKRVGHTLHVNVYLINRRQFFDLETIARKDANLELFLDYLRGHDLPFIYNHPYWFEPHEEPNYRIVPDLIRIFPVVEYNMHRVRQKNTLTVALAEKFNRGIVATTDTHTGDLGRAYTLARGDTFREFFKNIEQRHARLAAQDLTLDILSSEMLQWMNLIFDPELSKPQTRIRTGLRKLDQGLEAVMKGALANRPLLKLLCEQFGYWVSWSRLPAWCYLRLQNSKAIKIRRELRTAGVV